MHRLTDLFRLKYRRRANVLLLKQRRRLPLVPLLLRSVQKNWHVRKPLQRLPLERMRAVLQRRKSVKQRQRLPLVLLLRLPRRLVRKPLLVLLQPELLQKRHVKRLCRRSVLLLVSVLFVRQKSRKLLLRLHKKRLRLVLLLRRLVPIRWRVRLKQIVWLPNARLMPTVNVLLVRLKLQELLLLKTMICSVLPIVR